jgi:uncharacterized protein YjbJ (UPF0337 family)
MVAGSARAVPSSPNRGLTAEATQRDPAAFPICGSRAADHEEKIMDKDRVEGAAHQAKGAVKEAAGRMLGDKKTEAEGKAERAAGKVQNAVGGAKDAVRDAVKEFNDR